MPGLSGLSPAVADLGLGDMLGAQVKDETEEQRKKRMQQLAQSQMTGGSPAASALFGTRAAGAGF